MVGRGLEGGAGGGEAGRVGGVHVAGVGHVLLLGLGVGLDRHRLIGHVVHAEEVREVELGGGAGLDADRGAVQFLGRGHAQVLADHEALAVIVVHADEFELEVRVARVGPGRVARQDVDLARGQRGEAGLAGGRGELGGPGIAEDRGGDGTAHGHVEALPFAGGVGEREAHETRGHAALHEALGFDVVERSGGSRACHEGGGGGRAEKNVAFHVIDTSA